MKKTALIITASMVAAWAGASIVDNFNNTAGGAPDLTWVGDTTGFSVQASTSGEGAGVFIKTSLNEATLNSFATDITAELALDSVYTFSAYIGGDSARRVNGSNYAALVLLSDSSDAAAITAGTMNGYRLGIFAGDQVELQKASGAGWATLGLTGPAGLNLSLNSGFSLSATIDSATGNYSWGYVMGSYTDTVAEGVTGNDAGFVDPTGTTYGGFTYVVSTADTYFVDAYNVSAIPEPATIGMVAAMGAGMFWIRRRFTI